MRYALSKPKSTAQFLFWHVDPTTTPHKAENLHCLSAALSRLLHSPSLLTIGLSVGYEACLLSRLVWLANIQKGDIYKYSEFQTNSNVLWGYVTSGNSHQFSQATHSPLYSHNSRQNCLLLGLCKETVKQSKHSMATAVANFFVITEEGFSHSRPCTALVSLESD